MNKTKIEWCKSTWNPVTGCYHDCKYCYARRIACRFGEFARVDGNIIKAIKLETNHPCIELKCKVGNPYPEKFTPTLHRYRLNEYEKKKGRTIFVCSMADLFGSWVPDEWIDEVFAACERAPQHKYLFLTKNPQRYLELESKRKLPWADNFWFGTSVTNSEMEYAWFNDKKFHWFLSVEPILERLGNIKPNSHMPEWIIVGAETGNRKNKIIPKREWIEDIVELCYQQDIPIFMKDSLIPIVGEENMRREFPASFNKEAAAKHG